MVAAAAPLRIPCHCFPEGSGSGWGKRSGVPKFGKSCCSSTSVGTKASVGWGKELHAHVSRAVPVAAVEARLSSNAAAKRMEDPSGFADRESEKLVMEDNPPCGDCSLDVEAGSIDGSHDRNHHMSSAISKSTNIVWHQCPVGKTERQSLLGQKGCLIWITGLSGSGKSTLACALNRELHCRGHLTYVLDGDNVRHGLNRDLTFKSEDRAENIRRIGEVGKLFVDAGIICIASLISPYRRDRDACRALLPKGDFIEVFIDTPIELCEERDSKGLYKLAREGKITGFTGIDDPYEAPQSNEITIKQKGGACPSPTALAEEVVSYLERNGYLKG